MEWIGHLLTQITYVMRNHIPANRFDRLKHDVTRWSSKVSA